MVLQVLGGSCSVLSTKTPDPRCSRMKHPLKPLLHWVHRVHKGELSKAQSDTFRVQAGNRLAMRSKGKLR